MHYSKLFMVVRVDVILSDVIILHAKDIEEHAETLEKLPEPQQKLEVLWA